MGCTVREKHIRTTRRSRPVKNETDHASAFDRTSLPKPIFDAGVKPLGYHVGVHDSGQNSNLNPNFDDSGWGYCTEEQLEEILLKNLEFLYSEAISKIVALGYDDDVALKAVLRNGNWYGSMDMLTNILHNSLTYLNSNCGGGSSNENSEEAEPFFSDLKQLEQYSLASMVSLLQQMRPNLSKGDAMWCLLMCDLHVGKATSIEIPVLPSPTTTTTTTTNNNNNNGCGGPVNCNANVESVNSSTSVGVAVPPLCKFHSGWGFGNGPGSEFPANGIFQCSTDATLQRDIECPKRFNLSPSMKSLLKRNVAMFAAGFRASSKQLQAQSQACPSSVSCVDATTGIVTGPEVPAEQYEDPNNSKNLDMLNTMLSKFREMNLDENLEFVAEDQKDEMVLTLIHQIKDLDRQVKERREWAHQKAMQAARKLSNDLTELKMLRMEMEETQRLKKGKQTLEDTTMKKLSEMENALRKASGQVDRANAAVRRLEIENAEIRAEMEASKLSASESVTTCLEVAKREKKCLKRLLAWEKQKAKLQEEIGEEKRKVVDLQQQLIQVEQAQKESEVKWRQDLKAKELAFLQLEEERRAKEAAESNNKRKLESLRLKIEIDFQRHKDDIQRLEQEFTHLKASAQSTELVHPITTSPIRDHEGGMPQGETIAKLLHELDKLEDSSEKGVNSDRECIICLKDEVSVVFLPCAHEVICANCNEDYGKKVKPTCPCCRAPIEQTIRTFGASS